MGMMRRSRLRRRWHEKGDCSHGLCNRIELRHMFIQQSREVDILYTRMVALRGRA